MKYIALNDYPIGAPPRKITVRGRDRRVGIFPTGSRVDAALDLELAGILEYPDGTEPTALSAVVPLFKGASDAAIVAVLS